jgi:hypothetical protein
MGAILGVGCPSSICPLVQICHKAFDGISSGTTEVRKGHGMTTPSGDIIKGLFPLALVSPLLFLTSITVELKRGLL